MIFLLLIIIVHILVLSKLVFFPYPELFVYPYLTNHGLLPYKDILDQHFPGLMFFPVNLDNLGMVTPLIARYWQYGVVVMIHILLFLISKKIFKSNLQRFIPNILFLIWQPFFEGWVLWIDSFLPIFVLTSLYFLLNKKNFWAGLFLGVALLFKQVILPLFFLITLYLWLREKSFRKIFSLGLGVSISVLYLFFYVTKLNIWSDFIYWTYTFNVTLFAEGGRKFGTLYEWLKVFGVYGFGFLSLVDKKQRENVLLISIYTIGLMASIYARFDFVHLQPSLPFICILSSYTIWHLFNKRNLKLLMFGYILVASFLLTKFYKSYLGNRIYFFGETEMKVAESVTKLTSQEDKIFALGTTPQIYQMANRLPSGNIFVFQFPWFMIKAEDRVYNALVSDQPKVIIRDSEAEVSGQKLLESMPKISEFVKNNYKTIEEVENIEVLIKK